MNQYEAYLMLLIVIGFWFVLMGAVVINDLWNLWKTRIKNENYYKDD